MDINIKWSRSCPANIKPEKVQKIQETSWLGNAFFSLAGSLLLVSQVRCLLRAFMALHCSSLLHLRRLWSPSPGFTAHWSHCCPPDEAYQWSRDCSHEWKAACDDSRVMCPDNGPRWSPHHGQPGAGPGHAVWGVRQHGENNSIFSPSGLLFYSYTQLWPS